MGHRRAHHLDIRQQITDDIIKAIEAGTAPWRKGWASGAMHCNAHSGQVYQGINQVILGMQPRKDPRWLTYKQAEHIGLQVRKGEHGVRIVKMVEVDRRRAESTAGNDGEVLAEEGRKALVLKAYTVFNAEQIEGMEPMPERKTDVTLHEAMEAMVWGMQDTGMKLNFGGNQPYYSPRTDAVHMPVASDFGGDMGQFYSTLAHELCHATGHPKRNARLHLDARFGSAEYAREELTAELASSLTLASMGGDLMPSSAVIEANASYMASWLEVLRKDKQEIFRVAAQAQKACDYLLARAMEAAPKMVDGQKEQASEMVCEPVQAKAPSRPALG